MIAAQGPNARDKVIGLVAEDDRARVGQLGKFSAVEAKSVYGAPLFIARTGYTGEAGSEIVLPQDHAAAPWDEMLAAGVKPAGLGACDPLRLAAGLPLDGTALTEPPPPYYAAASCRNRL